MQQQAAQRQWLGFGGLSAHLQINVEFSCDCVGIGILTLTEAGGDRTKIRIYENPNTLLQTRLWQVFTSRVSSALRPFDALILLFRSFIHFSRLSFPELHLSVSVDSQLLTFLSSPPFSVSDQSNILQFHQQNCRNHGNGFSRQLKLSTPKIFRVKWTSSCPVKRLCLSLFIRSNVVVISCLLQVCNI